MPAMFAPSIVYSHCRDRARTETDESTDLDDLPFLFDVCSLATNQRIRDHDR